MKNKITKLGFALLFIAGSAYAQNAKSVEKIVAATDVEFLNQYENGKKQEMSDNLKRAYQVAEEMNMPISGVNEDGSFFQLMGIDEAANSLRYYKTYNNTKTESSLQTANAKPLQALGITGKDMNVGLWDGGVPYTSHPSLKGRVVLKQSAAVALHPTHVAGTIAANNAIPEAKGFAPEATIWAYDYYSDIDEMTPAATKQGLLVSNHSYGLDYTKWTAGPGIFGRYEATARAYDELANAAPYYTMVFAAGNDRTYGYNPTKKGSDLLSQAGVSKNTIVVASTKGTEDFSEVAKITSPITFLSVFSSWGPTDDFRIKPDISAKGDQVVSLSDKGGTAVESGTSMATPAVTGVVVLWQEYFHQLFGEYMYSATVRALMAHSAREAGEAEGPDYKFGWGLIDADAGAQVMREKTQKKAALAELTMNQGESLEYEFEYDGNQPLIATIAWNDPAGSANNLTDSKIPVLVNDLDLKIVNVDTQQEFLPWALKNNKWNASGADIVERKVNSVDNIERVNVNSQVPGNYKVVVTHKGNLKGGSQDFTLIVSGAGTEMADIGNLSTKDQNFSKLNVYPNPTTDVVNVEGDLSELQGAGIMIYDMTGRKVLAKDNSFSEANIERINVSNLPQGLYLLDISNNGMRQILRFVKK